jgi:hypothetical protein
MKAKCRFCDKETEHDHLHDTAHGIADTHMAGSERFTCRVCERSTYADQCVGDYRFKFVLDRPHFLELRAVKKEWVT